VRAGWRTKQRASGGLWAEALFCLEFLFLFFEEKRKGEKIKK